MLLEPPTIMIRLGPPFPQLKHPFPVEGVITELEFY